MMDYVKTCENVKIRPFFSIDDYFDCVYISIQLYLVCICCENKAYCTINHKHTSNTGKYGSNLWDFNKTNYLHTLSLSLQWRHNDHHGVSHLTNLIIACSTVYSGTDQRKHQSSASLAFVSGIHRWPGTKGQWLAKCFHLMTSSCIFIKLGNLTAHLEEVEKFVKKRVPDPEFSGLGVIDFETWFAIADMNFRSGGMGKYRDESFKLAKKEHQNEGLDDKELRKIADEDFNRAARFVWYRSIYDVVTTSKRRHFDIITSKWRRFDVITPLLLRQVFGRFFLSKLGPKVTC